MNYTHPNVDENIETEKWKTTEIPGLLKEKVIKDRFTNTKMETLQMIDYAHPRVEGGVTNKAFDAEEEGESKARDSVVSCDCNVLHRS